MIFVPTKIDGAYRIRLDPRRDERGWFARAWCVDEFSANGLNGDFVQANLARTRRRGTLRGLHYQVPPHAEGKLIRCIRGAICDVIADARNESPSRGSWLAAELDADGDEMLYIPPGCAHGYQTLTDDAEVLYLVSARYAPGAERGIRFDDAAFGIDWPIAVTDLSEKDRQWPDFAF